MYVAESASIPGPYAPLSLSLSLVTLFVCAAVPVAVHAQAYWQEVAVPLDSVQLDAKHGEYFEDLPFVVRQGQQRLFVKPDIQYKRLTVEVAGVTHVLYDHPYLYETSGRFMAPVTLPPGRYPVTVHMYLRFSDFEGLFSNQYVLNVVPPAVRAFRDPTPVLVPVSETENTYRYNSVLVWSSTSNPQDPATLDKPLLVVEGIDASQQNHAAVYFGIGANLFGRGMAEGADIAILDFADGARDMVENAYVTTDAIRYLQNRRSNPSRGLDVVGVSMGGVVARYALAIMESPYLPYGPHHVGRFLSLDAPQRGAVIHSTLQYDLANDSRVTPPLTFLRPASQQLLRTFLFPDTQPTNRTTPRTHFAFQQHIESLNDNFGYPRRTENVGVSFGRPPQSTPPTGNPSTGLRWTSLEIYDAYTYKEYFVTGTEITLAGSYLPEDITKIWGRVSYLGISGIPYVLKRHANPTFIPFESALDLSKPNGASRFDGPVIYPDSTSFHDVVRSEIVQPLLHRLGYEAPAPMSVQVNGPQRLTSGEKGWWTATTNLGPTYSFPLYWEYRLVWPGCWPDDERLDLQGVPGGQARKNSQKPGGGETNLINCGQWAEGSVSSRFQMGVSASNVTMQIRVRADDSLPGGSTVSVYSPVFNVAIGATHPPPDPEWSRTGSILPEVEALAFAVSRVVPQPLRAGQAVSFDVTSPEAGTVETVLYDVLGRAVYRERREQGVGVEAWRLEVPEVPAGTYVLRVQAGAESRTQVVHVQR